ncbi:hypothetical protein VNO78_25051 [Psophocarpus tetragonolobus]|uniref:Uncharacterized protein n=1 Tax=Psophocarpus tetragonolobus TaxID=3891 RepID=A0AAN9XEP7_PSOTE
MGHQLKQEMQWSGRIHGLNLVQGLYFMRPRTCNSGKKYFEVLKGILFAFYAFASFIRFLRNTAIHTLTHSSKAPLPPFIVRAQLCLCLPIWHRYAKHKVTSHDTNTARVLLQSSLRSCNITSRLLHRTSASLHCTTVPHNYKAYDIVPCFLFQNASHAQPWFEDLRVVDL